MPLSENGGEDGSLLFVADVPAALGSGQAIHFNSGGVASLDYVTVTSPVIDAAFNNLDFTVSFWFKANAILAGAPRLFEKKPGSGTLTVNTQGGGTNNKFRYKLSGDTGTRLGSPNVVNVTPDDPPAWHHLALVSNSATLEMSTYLDGVQLGSADSYAAAVSGVPQTGDGPLMLGLDASYTYDFLMDDFALFDEPLSADDIAGLAGGDKSPGDWLASAQPGDFNGDAQVEQGDLNLLLAYWGATTVPAQWTATFDGLVDQNELNDLLAHWGVGVPGAEVVGATRTVAPPIPEPATLGLLVLGGLVAGRRGWR